MAMIYDELLETLQYAKKTKGPVLVHVITKKGKGYCRRKVIKLEHGMEQDLIKLSQVTLLNPKMLHHAWSRLS